MLASAAALFHSFLKCDLQVNVGRRRRYDRKAVQMKREIKLIDKVTKRYMSEKIQSLGRRKNFIYKSTAIFLYLRDGEKNCEWIQRIQVHRRQCLIDFTESRSTQIPVVTWP